MTMASFPAEPGMKSASLAVAIVFTAYVAVVFGLGLYLFSLLAGEMKQTLGFGTGTIGTVTAAAQISFLIAAILCPRLSRRFGDAPVIIFAVLAAGAILAAVSAVGSAAIMTLWIGALGGCAALMIIPTVSVIARTVPLHQRSRVNGLISSGTAYGQFVAGWTAPLLVLDHGWRSVWLVLGIASVVVAIAGYMALKSLAPAALAREAEVTPRTDGSQTPLISRTNLLLWALLAASGMACGPWQNYLSTFLGEERGRSITFIGRLWSIVGFLGLFSGFTIGFLADRIGIRRALGLSFGLLALSALLVALPREPMALYVAALCFSLSFFAIYGLISAYISKSVAEDQVTRVFAGANICLGLGTAFGNLNAGYIIPGLTGSLVQVYFCIAIIAGLSAAAVALLPKEPGSL